MVKDSQRSRGECEIQSQVESATRHRDEGLDFIEQMGKISENFMAETTFDLNCEFLEEVRG